MQGVGEADGAPVVDVDQGVGLQLLQGTEGEGGQVQRQGLGEREAFEALALVGAGAAEDMCGALAYGGGDRYRAAPRPRVRVRRAAEQPALAGPDDQVAQQPQVSPAQAVQPVHGARLQAVAVRSARQQPAGLLAGQRLQGEAGQEFAGPQPGDRARDRGAVGRDDQQTGASVHGQLVDEGGGGVVEEMRVVDQEQPYAGQVLEGAVQGGRLGHEVRERGEADPAGLPGTGHPDAVAAADGLGDEPGFAAARGARDHNAVPSGGQGPADHFEFVLPAGERPRGVQGLRVPSESRHGNRSAVTHS